MALNAAFYDAVRKPLFKGGLSTQQFNALEAIDRAWAKYGDGDVRKLAYIMATAHHETDGQYGPQIENLTYRAPRIRQVWPSRFPTIESAAPYANNPRGLAIKVYGGRLGNAPSPSEDGWTFRGRAEPMLTGRDAYRKYGKLVGVDLEKNPDLILERNIGAEVLVLGMLQGFTGKPLPKGVPSYFNARDSINADKNTKSASGVSFGTLIAGYAEAFEKALRAGWKPGVAPVPKPPAARFNLADLLAAIAAFFMRFRKA